MTQSSFSHWFIFLEILHQIISILLSELDEGEIEWVAKHFDHNLDDIAMAYLGLSFVVVKNIKKRIQDRKAQKLEMIKRWMQKNPHNRLEVSLNVHSV